MSRILINNIDWLITMDPDRRIIKNGAIAIDDDRIAAIGTTKDVGANFSAEKIIDATGKLAIPGLIDTHVHSTQQLGRGLADGCDIAVHLLQRLYGYESEVMVDDAYWAALCCQLEMIRAGTTCFIDPGSYFPEQTAKATGVSGMRGIVARTAVDVHQTSIGALPEKMFRETRQEAVEKAEKVVRELNGLHDGRVRAWFSLRVLVACSDELIRDVKAKADELGVGIVMHACESRDEVVASRVQYGMQDVERMAHLGAIGPNMVLIHMGWASPKELVLCMRHDLKISCSPSCGYRLAFGSMEFGRFPEMLELGVTVSLGSDGAMSSNYLDIVREMFLASGGAKAQRLDPSIMPPETVLEMATIHGAKAALWFDEIGSLEKGKKADIAMFETRKPEWRPILNPLSNLVYASRGGADTVVCNGCVLLENGVIQTFDEASALQEAQVRGSRIANSSDLMKKAQPKWPVIE
ncbi:MAG: amidohydrolase family protein [Rhizobiales bacterium]|nr:amidohydrolase family protein [Hyphomicrobiales bacterium]